MSKKTLQKILDTLYHSYNGADGGYLAKQDAQAAIKELFMEVIGPDVEPNSVPGLLRDVQLRQNALRAELRKAVEAM